jgi:cytochrome c biogenesis protein CcmG/thiol:disulfide interchange protein DsbE
MRDDAELGAGTSTGVELDADDLDDDGGSGAPARSRSPLILVPVAVVAVLAAFVVVVLATREPAANRVVASPLVGRPAPVIEGTTLDGGTYSLASDQGRFTLVNFFATWCVPCRQEHDDLARWDERHRALGDAGVVSVVFDDSTESTRRFFDENGGDWPVVVGDNGIALDYGVAGVPESYLVGPDGTVLAKIIGGVTDQGLDELLARVQGGGG